ncbi:MAG: hypothetical protein J6Y29_03175 [Clostridiales bacterium]|nr:hypothetical protein [Clostridiales bacterium]
MSKELTKTRDEKEALELSKKLTNKVIQDLPTFWNEHKQQFLLNNHAIPEALKKSLRKQNTEMFDFFWGKSCEQQLDLSNNIPFLNQIIAIVTVLNSTYLLDHVCNKITLPKLILNTNIFSIILEGRYHLTKKFDIDMFSHLYQKCSDINFSLTSKGILAAASYKNSAAIDFCIQKELPKPNPKLISTWETATKIALQNQNIKSAQNIITNISKKIPNFNFENIILCAVEYNANDIVDTCLAYINKKKYRLYEEMFKVASKKNNITLVKKIGKQIKDSNIISEAFVNAISAGLDDMLCALEQVTSKKRDEFISDEIKIFSFSNNSPSKSNNLAWIYALIDSESIVKTFEISRVGHIPNKTSFKIKPSL